MWRKDMSEGVLFYSKLMWSIWTMWLLQHTPRVTSTTPHPRATGIALQHLPTTHSPSLYSSNKRRCISSILLREWANKTTACSYMYHSPSSLRNVFVTTHIQRAGRVACFPDHFLWSCCFIVLADPISLPSLVWFLFLLPPFQSRSHGSPEKEK